MTITDISEIDSEDIHRFLKMVDDSRGPEGCCDDWFDFEGLEGLLRFCQKQRRKYGLEGLKGRVEGMKAQNWGGKRPKSGPQKRIRPSTT